LVMVMVLGPVMRSSVLSWLDFGASVAVRSIR